MLRPKERVYVVRKTVKECEELVVAAYESAGQGSYTGIHRSWRVLSQAYLGITRTIVRRVLARIEARQLDRPLQTRVVRPLKRTEPNERWQCDLLEITKDAATVTNNGGIMFCCVTVDHYSGCILDISPMKSKSSGTCALIFQKIIHVYAFGVPQIWQSDNAGEFKVALDALQARFGFDVRHRKPHSSSVQGTVEVRMRLIREYLSQYIHAA